MTEAALPIVIAGEAGHDVGFGMTRKITAEHGAGGLSVAHAVVPPGDFVPPHLHTREDEATYVLQGELHVMVGDAHLVAGAGSWVRKPRGLWHAFWNAGPDPVRVIEVITPATLDHYFAELFALATAPGYDQAARQAAITEHHARYGITFDEARARDLCRQYGLVLP